MEVLMVQLNVEAERLDSFLEAATTLARASVLNEPGCRRFDIMQDLEVPTHIAFVEVFDDDAAVTAHPKFEHYPPWRAATAEGNLAFGSWERVCVRKCNSLFPNDDANFDAAIAGVDESFLSGSLHISTPHCRLSQSGWTISSRQAGWLRSALYRTNLAACALTCTRPESRTTRTTPPRLPSMIGLCSGFMRCTRTRRPSSTTPPRRTSRNGRRP